MKYRITCLVFLFPILLFSQSPCPKTDCACLLGKADSARLQKNWAEAISGYLDWRNCLPSRRQAEADSLIRSCARAQESAAKASRTAALASELSAQANMALDHGDRATAFLLAEWAARYVDPTSAPAMRALYRTVYYNDDTTISHGIPLPWYTPVRLLDEYRGGIVCLAVSPDGKRMASGALDKSLKIWDLETGRRLQQLDSPASPVYSLNISPDGKLLVAAYADSTVCIRDMADGHEAARWKNTDGYFWKLNWSPDGRRLIGACGRNRIKVMNAADQSEVKTLVDSSAALRQASYSMDGRYVATIDSKNRVRIWDLESGNSTTHEIDYKNDVFDLAFSPDGRYVAIGVFGGVKIIEAGTGQAVALLAGHKSHVTRLAYSPDGKRLASGSMDDKIKIWDLTHNALMTTLSGHVADISALQFTPDGQRLISGSYDYSIRIWDAGDTKEKKRSNGAASSIFSLSFSADGKTIASTSARDLALKLWDTSTGNLLDSIPLGVPRGCATYSRDGKFLAAACKVGMFETGIKIWDQRAKTPLQSLEGHPAAILSLCFSADGKRLASGSADSTIRIWNTATGALEITLKGHSDAILQVQFSPDGRYLASVSWDKTIKIWDARSGQELRTLAAKSGKFQGIGFFPDGKRLASASSDKTVRIWDIGTGRDVYAMSGTVGEPYQVAVSPDGKILAAGSGSRTLQLWDAETGREINALRASGYMLDLNAPCFSPDGSLLAYSTADAIEIWPVTAAGMADVVRGNHQLPWFTGEQLALYHLDDVLADMAPEAKKAMVLALPNEQIREIAKFYKSQAEKVPSYQNKRKVWRSLLDCLEPLVQQNAEAHDQCIEAYLELAELDAQNGFPDLANASYFQVLRLNPDNQKARTALGKTPLPADVANLLKRKEKETPQEPSDGVIFEEIMESPSPSSIAFANHLFAQKRYAEADSSLRKWIADVRPNYEKDPTQWKGVVGYALGNLSYFACFSGHPADAVGFAQESARILGAVWPRTNEGHGYLLSGRFNDAKRVYGEIRNLQNDNNNGQSMVDALWADLQAFAKAGIHHPDMARAAEFILGRKLTQEERGRL